MISYYFGKNEKTTTTSSTTTKEEESSSLSNAIHVRVNRLIFEYISKFKSECIQKMENMMKEMKEEETEEEKKERIYSLVQFVSDYDYLELSKEDLQKKKKPKPEVPMQHRCLAMKTPSQQCLRKKQKNSFFCGIHSKNLPFGFVNFSAQPQQQPSSYSSFQQQQQQQQKEKEKNEMMMIEETEQDDDEDDEEENDNEEEEQEPNEVEVEEEEVEVEDQGTQEIVSQVMKNILHSNERQLSPNELFLMSLQKQDSSFLTSSSSSSSQFSHSSSSFIKEGEKKEKSGGGGGGGGGGCRGFQTSEYRFKKQQEKEQQQSQQSSSSSSSSLHSSSFVNMEQLQNATHTIDIWAEEYQGIIFYFDMYENVYDAEEIWNLQNEKHHNKLYGEREENEKAEDGKFSRKKSKKIHGKKISFSSSSLVSPTVIGNYKRDKQSNQIVELTLF